MSKNENLIGDGTKVHSLPTIRGRHKDLKYITQETLSDVLKNKYSDVIKNFVIIDCRYPYEYEGGHIKEAVNLHTHEMVEQLLSDSKTNEGAVLIFHCEFSSERGPKMLRHLRKMDRKMNAENYPHLCYPEVYLLDGGYRDFFEKDQDNCFPQSYVPMLKKEHASDLRHFRSKSRSWNGFERKKCLRF